jgi:tetratricopeptide (TPR) repeat protein
VLVSGDVKRAIRGPLGERLKPQGSVKLDKMSETLPVFALAPAEGGHAKGRRLDLKTPIVAAVAIVILGLVGVSLWQARGLLRWDKPRPARVAIQPFAVEGNDAVLRQLAAVTADKTVEVLTANQVQTISAATGAGPQASDAAGATFVLGGSIRRDGDTLRISARITSARQNVVLWSAELARPSAQASTFRLEAASRLALVLRCAATARRDGLDLGDTETLSLYLGSCDTDPSMNMMAQVESYTAIARQILARAPNLSSVHSGLAEVSAFASALFPPGRMDELRQTARTEAERAIALDPRNGQAYVALAMLVPSGQRAQREALLLRALSVDPMSNAADFRYGQLLSETGRLQDALVYMRKAAALRPLDPGTRAEAALAQARAGQLDGADTSLKALLLDWPDDVAANGARFYLSRWEGRFDDALSMLQGDREPNRELTDADRKAWRDVLSALISRDPKRMADQRQAQIAFGSTAAIDLSFSIENLSQLGLLDDAFAQAEKLPGIDVPINSAVLFNPTTAAMRRDPRFMTLAAKLGLVDYWRTSGHWPDFCSEPGLPYDCKAEAAKYAGTRHG